MSLKGFHIVFITLATICMVGFAAWSIVNEAGASVRVGGILSGILGIAMAIYGFWFYRVKLKDSRF